MANEDQARTPACLFYSISAAEEAYRQQSQLIDSLGGKLDGLSGNIDELGKTLGAKLDNLTSLLEKLLTNILTPAPAPSATPASPTIETKPESTRFVPSPITDPITGLRPLNLGRSQSDPDVNPRREF